MKISLKFLGEVAKNLFKKPVTVEYPVKEDIPASEEYRGLHYVDIDKCIGCRLCARECPSNTIVMVEHPKKPSKKLAVVNYDACVFCYHCVYVCPVKAYVTSNNYKLAVLDKKELIKTQSSNS